MYCKTMKEGFFAHDAFRSIVETDGPCIIREVYSPCVCCDPEQQTEIEVVEGPCPFYLEDGCIFEVVEEGY